MRNTHQQPLPFKAMDGLTQRTSTDAIGTRQFGLRDFAARRDLPFDDGRLNAPKNLLREGFGILLQRIDRLNHFQHIVDTSLIL